MNTKNFETILFEDQDGIGFISINRPDKLNALNSQVLSELKELLISLQKSSLKGIILTGSGEKAFIAGADIKEMSGMSLDESKSFGELGQSVTLLLESLPMPVIAAVNGYAFGGGCEIAMATDFIYATNNAVFGQPEVKLGLIPGFGGTQRLAKIIGRNKAREIIYTGRNVSIEEAMSNGLVLKTFESKDELIAAAKKTILKISKNSPLAVGIAKKVMNDGNDENISEGLLIELNEFSKIFSSADMEEGTKAFLEKRTPEFTGK